MPEWNSDHQLFKLMQSTLYTPVVGDVLDTFGLYHQFLPPSIRPLNEGMRITGRAMPVLQIDVFGKQEQPFGRMTEALDDLQENEVYVSTGGTMRSANWGEIMTATAKTRRAAGAIVNGYHRDTPQVLEQDWPVFSRGSFAQDSAPRTKVVDFRCPIEIEATWIHPGDIIFGDVDGVVIIPGEHEKEVIDLALAKARAEKKVRKEIEHGMSSTEAFHKYGVL
jgi:4-hydroxy-4-methyl-2-oxoglutarate aldolase